MTSKGGLVGGVSSSHCITCGVYCRSHAYFLSHLASAHPTLLHSAPVGRLGKVFLYQQSGKLFHCEICFYSHRDFTQVWQHALRTHCTNPDQNKDLDLETKPRLNQDYETKPGQNEDHETKPGLNQDHETKPGLNQDHETKPGLNQDHETKPGLNQDHETKLRLKPDLGTGQGQNHNPDSEPGLNQDPELDRSQLENELENEVEDKRRSPPPTVAPPLTLAPPPLTLAPPPPVARPLTVAPPPSSSSPLFQLSSGLYHCLRCDWSHKIRTIAVNHVVRKHDSPQHLYDVIEPLPTSQSESASAPVEEEEEVTPEAITQELEATNILRFYNNRVECQCGWKAKVKRGSRGFALNHLERAHDLPRSHCCSICGQNFTMSYQLREHIKLLHRPGRYHCPFCIFRSDFYGGFRRHSSKCNYREEQDRDQDQDQDRSRSDPDLAESERIHRPKRRRTRVIMDDEEQ
ncbi:unnamed protein product [Knipowitschia caucasica]